jgi:hypothetical protein
MAEQPTRKRRIVRRAVVALAVVVLLSSGYVFAWLIVSRAAHDGYLGPVHVRIARPMFDPLVRFCETDLPAANALCALWWNVNPRLIRSSRGQLESIMPGTCVEFAPPVPLDKHSRRVLER